MSERLWYLVHTKPRGEETALANLERPGFEAFLPRFRTTVRRGGCYHRRIEALFPRYLFIRLDATTQDWHPVRSTVGVSGLVSFGKWPAVVPEDLGEGPRDSFEEYAAVVFEGCRISSPETKSASWIVRSPATMASRWRRTPVSAGISS